MTGLALKEANPFSELVTRLVKIPTPYQMVEPRATWVSTRLSIADKQTLEAIADSVGLKLTNMVYRLLKEVIIEHEKNSAKNNS